jgi:hypothetical protein
MAEVDLMVLDAADRERQIDLERADLRVDLVSSLEVDLGELGEDFVPLRDVALVELVVGLDGLTRDAFELVQLGLELSRCDLFGVDDERCLIGLLPETWPRRA